MCIRAFIPIREVHFKRSYFTAFDIEVFLRSVTLFFFVGVLSSEFRFP